jgi:hypothetical protein
MIKDNMMRGWPPNQPHPFLEATARSPYQYENLRQQLKLLTPHELRSLQNDIHCSLKMAQDEILTHEEREMLASLF